MSELVSFLSDAYPQIPERILPLVEPKRIPTPLGYHSTKTIASTLYMSLTQALAAAMSGNIEPDLHVSTYSMTYHTIGEHVPIFFVDDEFAEAVASTEAPNDFKCSDFKWPFNAMVIGFPVEFMKRYTGRNLCYVHCAYMPAGVYNSPVHGGANILIPYPKVIVRFLTDSSDEERLSNLMSVYKSDDSLAGIYDKYTYTDFTKQLTDEENESDRECLNKVAGLIFKLLTIITIKPGFILSGGISRPESVKKGRTKPALWTPNWIGQGYKTPGKPQGGTHASPLWHRVKGHFHWYLYGPGKTLRKREWTKPYWKGLD